MKKKTVKKIQKMRELAILKVAIRTYIFNEKYVQKKHFNCPTNEVAVILEHTFKGKLFHIPFEQIKGFPYSQRGIKIIDELQNEGILDPKTPDNVTMDCPYCYKWLFGVDWKNHKKCFDEYMEYYQGLE